VVATIDTLCQIQFFNSSLLPYLIESYHHRSNRYVCASFRLNSFTDYPKVNKQVIKADEKLLMSRVVDIMVYLDLRFIQEKLEDGALVYRLDP
jgi:hypothetical protein